MKKILLLPIVLISVLSCTQTPYFGDAYGMRPIYPDYMGVTIPSSIAPLNFVYTIEGADDAVTTFTCGDYSCTIRGRDVEWNVRKWRKLLSQAADGGQITVTSSVLDSAWTIHVSPDSIDYGIAYRLLSPAYETAGAMGIYERNLSSFTERSILTDTQFDCCMNCHTFNRCSPDNLSLHIRGGHAATLLRINGELEAFSTSTDSTLGYCAYPYWHPSGRYIAYSTNTTRQCFYMNQGRLLDVYDEKSDLQIYDIENNCLITSPSIKSADNWENYPAFSPDGKTLYFCSCPSVKLPEERDSTRYNLCSVSFDPETGTIGKKIDTLINAVAMGKNVAFPRPSYDGKYLMYNLFDCTCFPIWHDEADLWILELQTGQTWAADGLNSDGPESYHSWSSNSRWVVFSSRRDDGRYTRAYIAHVDENGFCGKPFMLPQRHPLHYYSVHSRSFNLPEFITGPLNLDKQAVEKVITSSERTDFGFRWSD